MSKRIIRNFFLFLIVASVIGLAALAVTRRAALAEIQREFNDEQKRFSALKAEIAQIESELARYEREKDDFAKMLFDERDVPAFLDEIAKYAKKSSVNIIDMKTQRFHQVRVPKDVADVRHANKNLDRQITEQQKRDEMTRAFTLSAMPIQIKIKGTFASFVQFLDQLQDYKQLLNIANVEIQTSKDYPVLECQFTIRIYSLKTLAELQLR